MSRKIAITFSPIAGTQAALGRNASGQVVIADRPAGVAGGAGLGFNGGELLAAALGGCVWNDLHHAAARLRAEVAVEGVEARVDLAGEPPRVVRAHVSVRMNGHADAVRQVYEAVRDDTTIASSLQPAFPIVIERLT